MVRIKSSSGSSFYDVTRTSCTCPDYTYRQIKFGGTCKHMRKLFFNKPVNESSFDKDFFRGGVDVDDALRKYNPTIIQTWISTGMLCYMKNRTKLHLLE